MNYNLFIYSCLSLALYEIIIHAFLISIFILFGKEELELLAVVTIVLFINVIILILVLQLLMLHLYFKIKGYSTFSYLNYNRLHKATKEQLDNGDIS